MDNDSRRDLDSVSDILDLSDSSTDCSKSHSTEPTMKREPIGEGACSRKASWYDEKNNLSIPSFEKQEAIKHTDLSKINASEGKHLPFNLSNLESVLGKERANRLLKNCHDIQAVSDYVPSVYDQQPELSVSKDSASHDKHISSDCHYVCKIRSDENDNLDKLLETHMESNELLSDLSLPSDVNTFNSNVLCSFKAEEIYSEASKVVNATAYVNVSCTEPAKSSIKGRIPSWLLLTNSFQDSETSDCAVEAFIGVRGGLVDNVSDEVVSSSEAVTAVHKSLVNVEHCWEALDDCHHLVRENCDKNEPEFSTNQALKDYPYSKDSIDRYFTSLKLFEDSCVAKKSVITLPGKSVNHKKPKAPPKLDVSNNEQFGERRGIWNVEEQLHSTFDGITTSFLKSIDNNDDELFCRLTSSVLVAEEANGSVGLWSVRDSEQFIYDENGEGKRSGLSQIPDCLKRELAVNLSESVSSTVMKQHKSSMIHDNPLASLKTPNGYIVGESMTFDYADVESPVDSLPDTLKEQLKLDLRGSCDFVVRGPKKSAGMKPPALSKSGKFLHTAQGTAMRSSGHINNRVSKDDLDARAPTNGLSEVPDNYERVSGKPITKLFDEHFLNSKSVVDATSVDMEPFHFKTGDFIKYKRERRSINRSSEDKDTRTSMQTEKRPRPRSSIVAGTGSLSRTKAMVSCSSHELSGQKEPRASSAERLNMASRSTTGLSSASQKSSQWNQQGVDRSSSSLVEIDHRNDILPVHVSSGSYLNPSTIESPDRKDISSDRGQRRPVPAVSQSTSFTASKGKKPSKLRNMSMDEFGKYMTLSPRISSGELSIMICLPDELILKIFKLLGISSIARCAAVCKRFYRIAMDPVLWKRIVVRKRNLNDTSLNKIGQHQPISIELCHCRGDGSSPDGVRDLFRQCAESLRELNITHCKSGQLTGDTLLLHASSRCRRISHIDASWTDVGPSALTAFSDSCDKLVSVCVNGCQQIGDEAVQSVVHKHGSSLRTLELFGLFGLTHDALFAIGKCCTNLVTLNVGQCWKLTDGSVAQLSTKLVQLENLDLRGCKQVKDHTVNQVVLNCTKLRTLSVASCVGVTDASVGEIACHCSQLRSLDLSGCSKVTNIGVKSLAIGCPLLEYLDISSTAVNHRSVTAVSSGCRKNLQVLKINFCKQISVDCLVRLARNCKHGVTGIQHAMAILTKPNRLQKLFLYGVTSVRNIEEVRVVNPDIWIER